MGDYLHISKKVINFAVYNGRCQIHFKDSVRTDSAVIQVKLTIYLKC